MPHTNRKKKPSSSTRNAKPTIVHTKRQEILDDEGWTHVVDTPRKLSSTLTKAANGGLHAGDFEIDGVGYVNRTLEEMGKEFEFWRKGWEESSARKRLGASLRGEVDVVIDGREVEGDKTEEEEEVEESAEVKVEEELIKESELEKKTDAINNKETEERIQEPEPEKKENDAKANEEGEPIQEPELEKKTDDVANKEEEEPIQEPELERKADDANNKAEESAEKIQSEEPVPEKETPAPIPTPEEPHQQRRNVDNIIVLGLGSLQSARREGRRATLTQLAALQTIVQHLGMRPSSPHFFSLLISCA